MVNDERPLRRDARLNRERIIAAAREVFAARGLTASLDDVARHAGVGVGTVYRRFPTKEALLEVALDERLEEHVRAAEAALAAPTGWDGLVEFLRRAAEMQAADRGLRDLVLGADFHARHKARARDRIEPPIRQLVDRAHREGSLRPDVTVEDLPLLLMMVSEVAHHSHTVRPDVYARYLQLLIDGLRHHPDAGDLGQPLTHDEVDALARQWMPRSQHRRTPPTA
jgi:AcrR family transcriptional regulator